MLRRAGLVSCAAVGAGAASAIGWPENAHLLYAALLDAVALPLLRGAVDPETAHALAIRAAAARLTPRIAAAGECDLLRTVVWGRTFVNPIGCAAGLDKGGEVCTSQATTMAMTVQFNRLSRPASTEKE